MDFLINLIGILFLMLLLLLFAIYFVLPKEVADGVINIAFKIFGKILYYVTYYSIIGYRKLKNFLGVKYLELREKHKKDNDNTL